jgi:hypothetical protein
VSGFGSKAIESPALCRYLILRIRFAAASYVDHVLHLDQDSLLMAVKNMPPIDRIYGQEPTLRYLTALHKDGQGRTFLGEMVVNASIAPDVLEILRSLYDASYPIEKMRLIDHYCADDQASMEDNNSSAFNFRPRAHQTAISKHALGLAIDINPLYNPYVLTTESGYRIVEPASAGAYLDRSADFPYKIERDDLCCTLFREHGFYWGGGWASRTKDFQHFER